jgi:O-antigen/teichoic acid export membrane protein
MIQRIKNKVNVLRADPHMQEVARGTLLAFVIKVFGAGLTFAFNVAIARLLGADGTGIYFLALSATAIASVLGRVGLDNTLMRFVASNASRGEWSNVKSVYALGLRMTIVASGLVSIIVFFSSGWLASVLYGKPALAEPLRWMSLAILPFSLMHLHASSLKGLKRIRDAMLVQSVGLPLVALMLVLPLTQMVGITGAVLSYSAGALVVAMLGAYFWHGAMKVHSVTKAKFSFATLWESCRPLLMVSLMNQGLMPWAPILLLGIWVGGGEVGIYGAATRIAVLVSFMLVTVNSIVAPKLAELHASGDMVALGSTARRSAALLTMLVSPLFVGLFIASDQVMALFGTEFAAGGGILSILLVGQLINVVCGSVGYLLMMSGNEKTYRNITMGAALLQLLLVLLLAPVLGGLGAAVAASIAIIMVNLASVVAVYKKFGIVTIPGFQRAICGL